MTAPTEGLTLSAFTDALQRHGLDLPETDRRAALDAARTLAATATRLREEAARDPR